MYLGFGLTIRPYRVILDLARLDFAGLVAGVSALGGSHGGSHGFGLCGDGCVKVTFLVSAALVSGVGGFAAVCRSRVGALSGLSFRLVVSRRWHRLRRMFRPLVLIM